MFPWTICSTLVDSIYWLIQLNDNRRTENPFQVSVTPKTKIWTTLLAAQRTFHINRATGEREEAAKQWLKNDKVQPLLLNCVGNHCFLSPEQEAGSNH